jgi:MFS transporter, SP family, general alpha glucoside:H+ symporter
MASQVIEAKVRPPSLADPDLKGDARVHEAANAIENEHNLGLFKSLRLYRKACLWSIFLSTCIIMEGFDVVLLNNLYAYPAFQRKFGVEQSDGTYQLTAAWQSGLSNGTLCGQIFGLFIAGILGERFGYRKTLVGALAGCCAFIFIIFFSETPVQLLIGEMLIGMYTSICERFYLTFRQVFHGAVFKPLRRPMQRMFALLIYVPI